MLNDGYKDIEHEEEFDTIEAALLTSCHICGTPLEWSLSIEWSEKLDKAQIWGASFSCGVKFLIKPNEDTGYVTLIL